MQRLCGIRIEVVLAVTRRPLGRALRVAGAAALVAACAAALLLDTGAGAAVTPGIKPDIVLSPKNPRFVKQYSSLLVNDLTPQADPSVVPTPDQCREPALDMYCDVYRVRIERDRSAGASNFVQLLMAWDKQGETPDLALVAAGLGASDFPDLEFFLYKDADTYIDYELVGGRSAVTPERLVWEATQDEYDVVIRSGLGVATGYLLRANYSNELFDPPFESLDGLSPPAGPGAIEDRSGAGPDGAIGAGATFVPQLALAPLDVDGQIAGIGLGTTEQFNPELLGLGDATRTVAATSRPPSAFILILAMLAFPMTVASFAFVVLRRRRDAFAS